MTRAVGLYAVAAVAAIGAAGWVLARLFTGAGSAEAIGLSAVVAAVVQIAAFGATRAMAPQNVMAAWGAGSALRLLTLVVYGVLAVKVLGFAAAPALLSIAVFFFLSTLLEPLFLRR
jgi:hypothetical protein